MHGFLNSPQVMQKLNQKGYQIGIDTQKNRLIRTMIVTRNC